MNYQSLPFNHDQNVHQINPNLLKPSQEDDAKQAFFRKPDRACRWDLNTSYISSAQIVLGNRNIVSISSYNHGNTKNDKTCFRIK